MSGLDKIAETIVKESQDKAAAIVSQAKDKAGDIAKRSAEKTEAYKKVFQETIKKETEAVRERFAADNRQARKQALLKTRSMVIEDIIKKAGDKIKNLPDAEYFGFMKKICVRNAQQGEGELYFAEKDHARLPGGFIEGCNSEIQNGSLKLVGSLDSIESGFVIKYGNIEQNCSIESIFETNKNLLWDTANSCLTEQA